MHLSNLAIILRLSLATLLGGVFGFERHRRHKPVGTRTYAVVCLTACAVSILSAYGFSELYQAYPANVTISTDPARLMVGLLSGIGFLGAGIIWRNPSGSLQGITSAATLVFVAVIGIGCGLGQFLLVLIASVIAYIIIASERMIELLEQRKARRQAGQSKEDDSDIIHPEQ